MLKDKIAVVTGSSSGIGRAVAVKLAESGAFVVVNANKSVTEGKKVVNDIVAKGGKAIFIQGDVSSKEGVDIFFNEIDRVADHIDIIVNNAGLTEPEDIESPSEEHWERMLSVNLLSCVHCCGEAIKRMKGNESGRIINTASIRGLYDHGRSGVAAYSASKAAVINFSKTLAKQVAPRILVNSVAPGFVETGYMERVDEKQKDLWKEMIPINRFIAPEEIADIYHMLATTSIFCGETIVVDGGLTLGD